MAMRPADDASTATTMLGWIACKAYLLFITITSTYSAHALTVPNLGDLAPSIYASRLNYRVAVGSKETPFQFKDLHVELAGDVKIPKAYSTGIHDASLLQKPFYINWQGKKDIELQNGGWEVVWSDKKPHGHLACSFVSSESVKRNKDASLDAGRFFMYHRVWTRETLASERKRRLYIQEEAAEKLKDRDEYFQKLADEKVKMGSKVLSYAKAAKSMNDYRSSGYEESLFIPLYDDQVLELNESCIVSTRGVVYKMGDEGEAVKIGESRVEFLEEE